ncbi:MAG TPA: hypothetical protein ACFYEK_01150 [Candidatus Wunengus sp. YC60]|uniref:hypothetical protein n=1 Tax=Candidatus Wunengus sp. YC60 TaxID=3367697 RepID=UPI00402809AA
MSLQLTPRSHEWLKEQAKEIYKFNGWASAPQLVQNHFIKMCRLYFKSNKITEINVPAFIELLNGFDKKEALDILVRCNNTIYPC